MSFSLLTFCEWLNATAWSTALREGDYPFPVIETLHIIGLGFSVGTIMWVDLRLLGLVMKKEKVSDVVSQLEPWAIGGFVIMFISGLLLLLSEPVKCYTAVAFRIKAVMLIMAGLNVLYFHSKVYGNVSEWDTAETMPWGAKFVGIMSFVLWFGIIVAGRWTAYL